MVSRNSWDEEDGEEKDDGEDDDDEEKIGDDEEGKGMMWRKLTMVMMMASLLQTNLHIDIKTRSGITPPNASKQDGVRANTIRCKVEADSHKRSKGRMILQF